MTGVLIYVVVFFNQAKDECDSTSLFLKACNLNDLQISKHIRLQCQQDHFSSEMLMYFSRLSKSLSVLTNSMTLSVSLPM